MQVMQASRNSLSNTGPTSILLMNMDTRHCMKPLEILVNCVFFFSNIFQFWIVHYSGNVELARILIEHGADINIRNTYGESPFFEAVSAGI